MCEQLLILICLFVCLFVFLCVFLQVFCPSKPIGVLMVIKTTTLLVVTMHTHNVRTYLYFQVVETCKILSSLEPISADFVDIFVMKAFR